MELGLKELLEAHIHSKPLIRVRQQPNIDNTEQILSLGRRGCPHHHNEVLLGLRSQLQCDALRQFFADGILNVPWFVLRLTVDDRVYFPVFLISRLQTERQLGILELLSDLFFHVLFIA